MTLTYVIGRVSASTTGIPPSTAAGTAAGTTTSAAGRMVTPATVASDATTTRTTAAATATAATITTTATPESVFTSATAFSQPTQKQQPQFSLHGTYDTHSTSNLSTLSTSATPSSQPRQSPRPTVNAQVRKEATEHEQRLADLFASRDDGQDTFGNIGALRFVILGHGEVHVSDSDFQVRSNRRRTCNPSSANWSFPPQPVRSAAAAE